MSGDSDRDLNMIIYEFSKSKQEKKPNKKTFFLTCCNSKKIIFRIEEHLLRSWIPTSNVSVFKEDGVSANKSSSIAKCFKSFHS